MRTGVAVLLAAGLAAVAAGCGGAGGASKADFVDRAGGICDRNKARASRAFSREFGTRRPRAGDGPRVLALILPFIRASGDGIAALEPPSGDDRVIGAYLNAYRAATRELEAIAADTRRAGALMAGRLEDPFTRADSMAGAYGIEKCSGDHA